MCMDISATTGVGVGVGASTGIDIGTRAGADTRAKQRNMHMESLAVVRECVVASTKGLCATGAIAKTVVVNLATALYHGALSLDVLGASLVGGAHFYSEHRHAHKATGTWPRATNPLCGPQHAMAAVETAAGTWNVFMVALGVAWSVWGAQPFAAQDGSVVFTPVQQYVLVAPGPPTSTDANMHSYPHLEHSPDTRPCTQTTLGSIYFPGAAATRGLVPDPVLIQPTVHSTAAAATTVSLFTPTTTQTSTSTSTFTGPLAPTSPGQLSCAEALDSRWTHAREDASEVLDPASINTDLVLAALVVAAGAGARMAQPPPGSTAPLHRYMVDAASAGNQQWHLAATSIVRDTCPLHKHPPPTSAVVGPEPTFDAHAESPWLTWPLMTDKPGFRPCL